MEFFGLSVHPSLYQKPIQKSLKRLRRDPRIKRIRAEVTKTLASLSVEALKFANQIKRPGERVFQVRSAEEGWMVCERGSSVPKQVYRTKSEATRHAKSLAKSLETRIEIFDRSGTLQKTQSFATT